MGRLTTGRLNAALGFQEPQWARAVGAHEVRSLFFTAASPCAARAARCKRFSTCAVRARWRTPNALPQLRSCPSGAPSCCADGCPGLAFLRSPLAPWPTPGAT